MAGRKIKDRDEAQACLAAAAASGMDRVTWAHGQGIDGRSLNAWRLNLERADRPRRPDGELRVVELVPARVAASHARARASYTVRVGDGFAVEVGEDFDDAVLARLLAVVAAC